MSRPRRLVAVIIVHASISPLAMMGACGKLPVRQAAPLASPPPDTPSGRVTDELPREDSVLPARIGSFTADAPVVKEGGAQRRTYVLGPTRLTVTLARLPMDSGQYDAWVKTSLDGFPQANLAVAPQAGNGFYQCTMAARPSCDLLIQLRSGVHIEIRGAGTSSQVDVDAIALGLPLAALALDQHMRNPGGDGPLPPTRGSW